MGCAFNAAKEIIRGPGGWHKKCPTCLICVPPSFFPVGEKRKGREFAARNPRRPFSPIPCPAGHVPVHRSGVYQLGAPTRFLRHPCPVLGPCSSLVHSGYDSYSVLPTHNLFKPWFSYRRHRVGRLVAAWSPNRCKSPFLYSSYFGVCAGECLHGAVLFPRSS